MSKTQVTRTSPSVIAVTKAMERAALLAREIAIQTNTGIVVREGSKIITRTADELRAEKQAEKP
jgi:hypothetical protein